MPVLPPLTLNGSPYFGRTARHLCEFQASLVQNKSTPPVSRFWVRRQDVIGWYGNQKGRSLWFTDSNSSPVNVGCLYEDAEMTTHVRCVGDNEDVQLCEQYAIPLNKWGQRLPQHQFVEARAAMQADPQLSPYWLTNRDLELFKVKPVSSERVSGLVNSANTTDPRRFCQTTCLWPMVLSLGGYPLEFQPWELLRLRQGIGSTCVVSEEQLRSLAHYSPHIVECCVKIRDGFGNPHFMLKDSVLCKALFAPPIVDGRRHASASVGAELQALSANQGYYWESTITWSQTFRQTRPHFTVWHCQERRDCFEPSQTSLSLKFSRTVVN